MSRAVTIELQDEIEALRVSQDLNYARNRAALGMPSLALVSDYLGAYEHLWEIATRRTPTPLRNDVLFAHEMLIECRADLVRTMLLAIRGHITDAHAQIRRAIECCAWARRIQVKPDLVNEWLTVDMKTPPSHEWRENMGSKLIFPSDHPKLCALRERYQMVSRCLHPFRFSFSSKVSAKENGETISVTYSFFDSEDVRLYLPTHFLWTLQTHDLIMDVFEQVFSAEIEHEKEAWTSHRKHLADAQTAVGKMWIEVTKRAEQRAAPDVPSGNTSAERLS